MAIRLTDQYKPYKWDVHGHDNTLVLALCAFLTVAILKGIIRPKKMVFDVCVFFALCGFVSGPIFNFF